MMDNFVSVRIDEEMAKSLEYLAKSTGRSRSALVRWLIHLALEQIRPLEAHDEPEQYVSAN